MKISDDESKIASDLQNSFIWTSLVPVGEQAYVAFRKKIELAGKWEATLRVFADTRYLLWINGKYVARGPGRFDPKRPEYDILHVSKYLKSGENVLVILVHSYTIAGFEHWYQQCARMMDHCPGLTARLDMTDENGTEAIVKTNATWSACAKTGYQPSPGVYGSIPDNIDARLIAKDWTLAEFDDSSWERATSIDPNAWGALVPREIPLLREITITPEKIVQETIAGEKRDDVLDLKEHLPLDMSAGDQVILDIGRTVQAYSVLEFDADEGTRIEVDYAMRFFDTDRQPERIPNFFVDIAPNSYIARSGRQVYLSGDTFACKYLVIKVTSGNISLRRVELVDRLYPYERLGAFHCNDQTLSRLWDVCVNTIEVCSEDAYVDCADRERAAWMGDGYRSGYPVSRVALAGPGDNTGYRYCDPRLLQNTLRHMHLSQFSDGRMQPMRPSEYPATKKHGIIDDYTCLWVQAMRENLDRTNDEAFARELWPAVVQAVDYFLDRRTEQGLVNAVEYIYFKNPLAYVECQGASINAYIYGALRDAAHAGRRIGEQDTAERFDTAADELSRVYNDILWDAQSGTYFGSILTDISSVKTDAPPSFKRKYEGDILGHNQTPATGHAAVIALYYDLVPGPRRRQVIDFMLEQFPKEEAYPYTYRYFLEVLYRQNTPEMDVMAMDIIREKFGPMTAYETRTTSEGTIEGWYSGSFVHESGAHPAYFLSTYVLGVRTEYTGEGLRLFIEPRLGNLTMAEGVVLCEFGPVSVCWERRDNNGLAFNLTLPKATEAFVSIPLSGHGPTATLIMDNKTLLQTGTTTGTGKLTKEYFTMSLSEGEHSGHITP